jgi:hypothetical protein
MLKWISDKHSESVNWIHLVQDKTQEAGSCEYGYRFSGSITGGEFLDQASDY